jgi:hypothetical protein
MINMNQSNLFATPEITTYVNQPLQNTRLVASNQVERDESELQDSRGGYYGVLENYEPVVFHHEDDYEGPWKVVKRKDRSVRKDDRCDYWCRVARVCDAYYARYTGHDVEEYIEDYMKEDRHLSVRSKGKNKKKVVTSGHYSNIKKKSKQVFQSHAQPESLLLRAQHLQCDQAAEESNELLHAIEEVLLLVINVANCNKTSQAIGIIAAFIHSRCKQSVSLAILDVCKRFLVSDVKFENYEFQAGNDYFASLIGAIEKAQENWKAFKETPIYKKLAKLICLIVTLGFLPKLSGWGRFTGPAMEFFFGKAFTMMSKSTSMYEAIVDISFFFITRGYKAFFEGDTSVFFYDDKDLQECEQLYNILVAAEPLIKTGQLALIADQIPDGHYEIKDLSDYMNHTTKLTDRITLLYKQETDKYLKERLNIKILRLRKIMFDITMIQKTVKFKHKPYTIMITGPSGIGKSSLNSAFITTIMGGNNKTIDESARCVINDTDAFDSEILATTRVITLDDWANLRSEKAVESTTRRLVDFCNNIAKFANKATLEEKGAVLIQPDLVTVTTNVTTLEADIWSNEPASIMRRFDLIIHPILKSSHKNVQGTLDFDKSVADKSAWDFDAYTVRVKPSPSSNKLQRQKDGYEFVKVLSGVDIFTINQALVKDSRRHFAQQNYLVENNKNITNQYCKECECSKEYCHCDLKKQSETEGTHENLFIGSLQSHAAYEQTNQRDNDRFKTNRTKFSKGHILSALQSMIDNISIFCLSIPLWFKLVHLAFRAKFCKDFMSGLAITNDIIVTRYKLHFLKPCTLNFQEYDKKLTSIYRDHERSILIGLYGIAAVAFLNMGYQLFKKYSRLMADDGYIPQSGPVLKVNGKENVWKNITVTTVPTERTKVGVTSAQLDDKIANNLYMFKVFVDFERRDGNRCWAFPLKENLWLVPSHTVYDRTKEYIIELTSSRNYDTLDVHFCTRIAPEHRFYIPKYDLCVVKIIAAGSQPDFTPYILDKKSVKAGQCLRLIQRDLTDFSVMKGDVRCESNLSPVRSENSEVGLPDGVDHFGYLYTSYNDTSIGSCMSILHTGGKCPVIVGFHVAGKTGTKVGLFSPLYMDKLNTALDYFSDQPMRVHSEGTFDTFQYGIDLGLQTNIHDKSPVNFMDDFDENGNLANASVKIFGAHSLGRSRSSTNVEISFISDDVNKIEKLIRVHEPPSIKGMKKHWHKDLTSRLKNRVDIPFAVLNNAVHDLQVYLSESDYKRDESILGVLDHYTIINGRDGVYGIDALNMSTSMGFPLNKPKKNYLYEIDKDIDGISRVMEVPDDIMQDILLREDNYRNGRRNYPIFRTSVKDEAVKINKDKRRLFEAAPFWYIYLMRKYCLTVCAHIMEYRLQFCTAVGANCYSSDWKDIAEHMQYFGSNRYIAGDYKAFDKKMPCYILLAATDCILDIMRGSGKYTKDELFICQGIFTDLCFPVVEYDGVIMQFYDSHCSGNSLTVIINNFANLIYMRCAYYDIYNGLHPPLFHTVINILVYGDDNIAEISLEEKRFNHKTCSDSLAKFGIVYTMADKEAESVPFIEFSELEFLKRRFVMYEDIYLCPLDLTSISKSLHTINKNKNCYLSERQIVADILRSAFNELLHHGENIYNEVGLQLYSIVMKYKMQAVVGEFVPFEERMARFYNDYERASCVGFTSVTVDNNLVFEFQSQNLGEYSTLAPNMSRLGEGELMMVCSSPSEFIDSMLHRYSEVCNGIRIFSHCIIRKNHTSPNNKECESSTKSILDSFVDTRDQHHGLSWIDNTNFMDDDVYTLQSAREYVTQAPSVMETENFTSVAAQPGSLVGVSNDEDSTFDSVTMSDNMLGSFLSRPALIDRIIITNNTRPFLFIFPWTEYFKSPAIVRKTSNYAWVRGRLHVRFEVTGSPFKTGKIMCSYMPNLAGPEEVPRSRTGGLNTIVQSQRMKIFLNVTNGQGGDMILPFFHPYDYLSVGLPNYDFMGRIDITPLATISSINSFNQEEVTISVYAHLEDVKLVGPTFLSNFALQSSYETGPVSKPASVISNISNRLRDIPVIGPYMRATSKVAGITASVAAMLGYCRPIGLEDDKRVITKTVGNMANANVIDTAYKLSLDAKQERTLDPRTVGLSGKDELAILNVVSIESIIGSFDWTVSDPSDKLLFISYVSPVMYTTDFNSEPTVSLALTPSCVISQCFKYWRGGMKFRFLANNSALYRGKLKIVYEPANISLLTSPALNTNYTYIMDLVDTDDFTVCINWCNQSHYLQCFNANPLTEVWDTTESLIQRPEYMNGIIRVYVMNSLSSPGDVPAFCTCTVLTSMCDDADFAVPSTANLGNFQVFQSQSSYEGDPLSAHEEVGPSGTSILGKDKEFGDDQGDDHQNVVWFGEKIISMRQMMKRYSHVTSESIPFSTSNTLTSIYKRVRWRLFGYRGVSPQGNGLDVDGPRFNLVSWTFTHWMTLCFAGRRGGLRYKYIMTGPSQPGNMFISASNCLVTRRVGDESYTVFKNGPSSNAATFMRVFDNSAQGMAVSNNNNVLEVEYPDYSNTRYLSASRLYPLANDDENIEYHVLVPNQSNDFSTIIHSFMCASEDYSLFYWLGMPILTSVSTPEAWNGGPVYPLPG